MSTPTAFISYSWDDEAHKGWVRNLASRLRGDGVDVTLDQWHLVPGDQLPEFMERAVRENSFVLIICTPRYKERSERRTGGVSYEGDIITGEIMTSRNQRKFIPILGSGTWAAAAPTWLSGKYYIDLSGSPYSEARYKDLSTTLLDQRPQAPPVTSPPTRLAAAQERREPPKVDQAATTFEPIKIKGIIADNVQTSGRPLILDGISINQAAELLFDVGTTFEQRRHCQETYRRCLEDLAFAVVLWPRVGSAENLGTVARTSPGKVLLESLGSLHVHPPELSLFDASSTLSGLEQLATKEPFRSLIIDDLRSLNDFSQFRPQHWRDLVLREAHVYLACDSKFPEFRGIDIQEYGFGHPRGYLKDSDFEAYLPTALVDDLSKWVVRDLAGSGVAAGVITTFARRVLATHVAIFYGTRDVVSRGYAEGAVHAPHVTRTALLLRYVKENKQREYHQRIQTLLVPHVMATVLNMGSGSRDPKLILDNMQDLRSQPGYEKVREYIQLAIFSMDKGDDKEFKKLKQEILSRSQVLVSGRTENFTASVAPGPFSFGRPVSGPPFERVYNPLRHALRHIMSTSTKEYRADLAKVFPEFKEWTVARTPSSRGQETRRKQRGGKGSADTGSGC